MAPRKSKSRTRTAQQRRRAAVARQDAEREELRRLEEEGYDEQPVPWYRRMLTRVPREPVEPERADEPRPGAAAAAVAGVPPPARRGFLTPSLMAGGPPLSLRVLGLFAVPH